jgi:glyoxylase I family protein
MSIDHVLAVIPVADFEAAHAWYERLFGRRADNLPEDVPLVVELRGGGRVSDYLRRVMRRPSGAAVAAGV